MNTSRRSTIPFGLTRWWSTLAVIIAGLCVLGCPFGIAQSEDQPAADTVPPSMIDSQSPTVAVTFSDGRSLSIRSHHGHFPLVAASAGETVSVKVKLAVSNGVAAAQCLDGGTLSDGAENISLADDGSASFQFQVGSKPGIYRVALTGSGGAIATLQFWVTDTNAGDSNPPALQAN
jgi:hypothetical protein